MKSCIIKIEEISVMQRSEKPEKTKNCGSGLAIHGYSSTA